MSTSNNKKNDQASSHAQHSQRGSGQQEETMPSPQFAEGSTDVSQDTQAQAMAYLFGLLPSQDSLQFERQIEEQASCRDTLQEAQSFQEILSYWSNSPAPSGLSDRTLSLIQKQTEKEHVGTAGGDTTDPSYSN